MNRPTPEEVVRQFNRLTRAGQHEVIRAINRQNRFTDTIKKVVHDLEKYGVEAVSLQLAGRTEEAQAAAIAYVMTHRTYQDHECH